jgi:hypothetical protein
VSICWKNMWSEKWNSPKLHDWNDRAVPGQGENRQ